MALIFKLWYDLLVQVGDGNGSENIIILESHIPLQHLLLASQLEFLTTVFNICNQKINRGRPIFQVSLRVVCLALSLMLNITDWIIIQYNTLFGVKIHILHIMVFPVPLVPLSTDLNFVFGIQASN